MSEPWRSVRLGEVATIAAGNSAPQDKALFTGGTHRFVRTSDVGQVRVGELEDSVDKLNDKGALGLKKFRAGVTLVPKSGASTFNNHRVILTAESCVSSHLAVVDPHTRELDDRFAFYFLQTVRAQDLIGDQSYPSMNLSHIEGIAISLPPLAEQKRIAAKLDQAEVNTRKLGSGLAEELLKLASFRRSAIDQLFETLESATKRLDEVCAVFTDGDWIESKDQSATGIRLIQTGNVGDGVFKDRRDKARWIDQSTFDRLRCTEIHPGDILISRLPDPVGRACQIPDTGDRMITAVDCTIARPIAEILLSEFLVLFTSSSIYFEQVRSMITGTTRDRISRKNLGSIEVPTPPLAAQIAVVKQASALDVACGDLASNIETRINKIAELRQSMLETAFRGQL